MENLGINQKFLFGLKIVLMPVVCSFCSVSFMAEKGRCCGHRSAPG